MRAFPLAILHVAVYFATLHRATLALCNIPAASHCASIFNSAFTYTNYPNYHQLCPSYRQAVICNLNNVDSSFIYDSSYRTYRYCYVKALTDAAISQFVSNAQQIDQCCANYFSSYLWSYFGRRSYTCPVTSVTTVAATSPTTSSVCPSGCCATAAAYCCSRYNTTFESATNYRATCSSYKKTVKCLEVNMDLSYTRSWCSQGWYNPVFKYFASRIVPIVDNCCGQPMAPHYSNLQSRVSGFSTIFKCPHSPLPTSSSAASKPFLNYWLIAVIGIGVLVVVVVMIAVTCIVVRKRRASRLHASSRRSHPNAAFENHVPLPAISTVDVSAPPVIEPLSISQEEEDVEYYNDAPPTLPPRGPMSPSFPTQPPEQKKARGLFRPMKKEKVETPKQCPESKPTQSRGKLGKLPPKPPNVILKHQLRESARQDEPCVTRLYPDISHELPEPKTPTAPELQDEDSEESYDRIW